MTEETGGQPGTAVEAARERLSQKQPAEAARILREHLAGQAGTVEEQMLLGVAAAQSGDNRTAIEALEQAVKLDPNHAVAHFNLGQVYRQVGRLKEAQDACERALQLRPEYPAAAAAVRELRREAESAASIANPPASERLARLGDPPPAGAWAPPGAPAYGAPSPARDYIAPVSRPLGVSILVVLYDIGAVIMVIGGVVGLVGAGLLGAAGIGSAARPGAPSGAGAIAVGGVIAFASIIALLLGLALIVMGYFLWKGYSWSRWGFMVLLVLDILRSLPALRGSQPILAILSIVLGVLFLIILNTQATREYCTR